jgi:chromosome segregation ATPase
MDDKKLYIQKLKAQLDEWKADIDKLKAKASGADADVRIKLNKHIKELEHNYEKGREKIAELTKASGEAWDSLKKGTEDTWSSMKKTFSDVSSKFKNL